MNPITRRRGADRIIRLHPPTVRDADVAAPFPPNAIVCFVAWLVFTEFYRVLFLEMRPKWPIDTTAAGGGARHSNESNSVALRRRRRRHHYRVVAHHFHMPRSPLPGFTGFSRVLSSLVQSIQSATRSVRDFTGFFLPGFN